MSTPHINGNKGDFAETILFPGDPLRAKYIAETYLSNTKEISNVRNMLAYTGIYRNKQISVVASGMGIPSSAIYATELITQFGVKNIIRIGTAGALNNHLQLNDIILVMGASTDSNVNRIKFNNFDISATCSFDILYEVYNTAKETNMPVTVGDCFTTDSFYLSTSKDRYDIFKKMNILCVDMETAGIYGLIKEYNVKALSILTISDIIENQQSVKVKDLTSKEREVGLNNMIKLALDSAIKLK